MKGIPPAWLIEELIKLEKEKQAREDRRIHIELPLYRPDESEEQEEREDSSTSITISLR